MTALNPVNKIKISIINLPKASTLLVQRNIITVEVKSNNPGPVVWLIAGSHGDEIGSVVVVQEIIKKLRRNPLNKGAVFAIPVVNPSGFEAGKREFDLTGEDINRSYPGSASGSLAERLAFKVFNVILQSNPTIVLDLHNDWRKSIPYTLIDTPLIKDENLRMKLIEFAERLGFVIVEEKYDPSLLKTLTGNLILNNIPALSVELGESYIVNEVNVDYGVKSIWNILTYLGMVENYGVFFKYPVPSHFLNKILYYDDEPVSQTLGIIRFNVKPGDYISKNQVIAKIYDVLGSLKETIKSPKNGILLGYSDSSAVYPGSKNFAFAFVKE
ncbi:MAG: succinylglutamate desuccinylase/aspartoacylase family protein [Candidatus Odinarchaeum yellowstonii]|uniref:Succinylglutamate desuccinylase/aspartoacylase family protein n=1 Tax=Odinarchaeota yellowstonii (strain LCB_4) TaxID=1841599 RepID=A0AAF0IBB6_ODILC|nr:MAG: succinylglutamate desuccinylase/aspartoacylase family protein [Candidatus Odinarchaeum yellowstonii]